MPEFKSALLVVARPDEASPVVARLQSAGFRDVAVRTASEAKQTLIGRRFDVVAATCAAVSDACDETKRTLIDADAVLLVGEHDGRIEGFARANDARTFPEGLIETVSGLEHAENDLMRGAAHALSNRLQAAMGWASLLEFQQASAESKREATERVRDELSLLGRFAQGLATLAGRSSVGAPPAVVDMASVLSAEIAARGARLVLEGPPPEAFVASDELGLAAALLLSDGTDGPSPVVRLTSGDGSVRVAFPMSSPEALPAPGEGPGSVMRRVKRTSALGATLLMRIGGRFGGRVEAYVDDRLGPTIALTLPLAASRDDRLASAEGLA